MSPFLELLPQKIAQPIGELAPNPKETHEQDSQENHPRLSCLSLEKFRDESENEDQTHDHDEDSDKCPEEPFEELPKDRYLGLRRGELATAAPGTHFSAPGVRVKTRTEFFVITPSAS